MDQPVIRGGFLMLQVTFCIHNFLDYLRKDSACASGEYGLFQFIFESLPQKNQCPGDAKWEIFSNFAKNGHGLYQLLAIAQVESWRLFLI